MAVSKTPDKKLIQHADGTTRTKTGQFVAGTKAHPNAGRKTGHLNAKNRLYAEMVAGGIDMDTRMSPFVFMQHVMEDRATKLGLPEGTHLSMEVRYQCAKELAGYERPKLKSIEFSGDVDLRDGRGVLVVPAFDPNNWQAQVAASQKELMDRMDEG